MFQGERYPVNETFIDKRCSGVCSCNDNGSVGCVSLCPPVVVLCAPGQMKVPFKETFDNSECFCEREMCIDVPVSDEEPSGRLHAFKYLPIFIQYTIASFSYPYELITGCSLVNSSCKTTASLCEGSGRF